MSGQLGIDFGTSNTVVAVWDEGRREGIPLHVPDFGRVSEHAGESISLIPSVIHYEPDGRRWVGQQVFDRDLAASERTFSLIKRYIAHRSPIARKMDGRRVSPFDAGTDFLSAVLLFAAEEAKAKDQEVALTVPVEAFEHYVDWLTRVAESAGLSRYRLIDEPSAAALGYGTHVQPGHVYLVFDFGGGTLDVAVVLVEEEEEAAPERRCRVLGKAGREIGGSTIDAWLMREVLARGNCQDWADDIRPLSGELLCQCRAAKETLSRADHAEVSVALPGAKRTLSARFTQGEFEELLDRNEMFSQIDQTIRRALNTARERGYAEDHIQTVLMVGGSSLIPSVQKTLQRIFGREKVRLNRPLDAVARGAAAFAGGVDFYDHIQHDYAVRWVNPRKGDYDYRVIVRRGTPYPTKDPVARLTVKAMHPGQAELGIAIFELGEHRGSSKADAMELVFDPSGAARLVQVTPDEADRRSHFWINEQSPTFLKANPPAQPGEARFLVEFSIDGNKRLLITARDLQTNQLTIRNYPVVKLT